MIQYRPEVDGLRAVAVLVVIFFHSGFPLFSGGFVGVDIFFVISGYLITSILLKQLSTNSFDLSSFYEKRARRILPALFFMLLSCLPFAWLWLLPEDLQDFSDSLKHVAIFLSNIEFYDQSGYFDKAAEYKPLLHTWSLAIEEQYYIIFPVLLFALWRLAKNSILIVVLILTILSFVLCAVKLASDPLAAFYLLPYRAWELLAGAISAILVFNGLIKFRKNVLLSQLISLTGFALILYAVLFLDKSSVFPGMNALFPVVGAMLVILFTDSRTFVFKLLANKLSVKIGVISYSFYLWHQPIFVFYRVRTFSEPALMTSVLLIILSLIMAYLSWRFIEQPFRDRSFLSKKKVFYSALFSMIVIVLIAVVGRYDKGWRQRLDLPASLVELKTVKEVFCHNDGAKNFDDLAKENYCVQGDKNAVDFALIGDSHAGALFDEVANTFSDRSFLAVSHGFCAPLINDFALDSVRLKSCAAHNNIVFDKILKNNKIKTIVLAAEWAYYTKGYRIDGVGLKTTPLLAVDKTGIAPSLDENGFVFRRSLDKTIDALKSAGKEIIIIEPTPEFSENVFDKIHRSFLLNAVPDQLSEVSPSISVSEYTSRNEEVLASFNQLNGVKLLKIQRLFCSTEQCHSASNKNELLFSDTNHVTNLGAKLIAQQLFILMND